MTDGGAINATHTEVRKFGVLFACSCAAVGGFMLYKGNEHWRWFGAGCMFFVATAFVGYRLLRPIYIAWMKFAFLLGWINTRLLLGVFFFLILTPIGLALRLFGRDILDEKIEPEAVSYWKRRETQTDAKAMERQF